MSIRDCTRSILLAAASATVVLGMTACGPTSEEGGTTESPAPASSEATKASPETEESQSAGESSPQDSQSSAESSPDGEGDTEAAPDPEGQDTESAPGTDGGNNPGAMAGPDKNDNDPALCDAADLAGTVEDIRGGATAGSVYRGLVLTNTSTSECILTGFPGVSFVDSSGKQIGAAATRNASKPAVSIELTPGASAMATLKQTNANNYGGKCGQTDTAGLRVYPPSAYDSLIVEQSVTACASDAVQLMTIGAFQPRK